MRSITLNAKAFFGLAAEILGRGRAIRFCPTGSSMAPTILPGDSTVIDSTDSKSVRVGDVVMVACNRPRIHRVTRIEPDPGILITKGDASKAEDQPVLLETIIGRVVRVERPFMIRLKRLVRRNAGFVIRAGRRA